MAALRYRDEHNKVGYLQKPKGSDDYHQILDFLRASHIRYALTNDPIIFDSLVKQFWSTATLRSPELGPLAILATIDETPYTITEDSVRSQLQLADDGGIDDLPIVEIYSGMDNLGTKSDSWDQFGSSIAVALICLSDGRRFNWSSYIFKGMVSNIGNAKKFLMYPHHLSPPPNPPTSDPFTSTNVEDAPLGGSFHASPLRSTQAPSAGHTLGSAEDLIILTSLSSIVFTFVQKVHSLETELKAHKQLFKDVVGKLVKKVKEMEVKLKPKKRKVVMSDSDQDERGEQAMDLDALIALANATVTVDSNIPPGSPSNDPAASSHIPTGAPTDGDFAPAHSTSPSRDPFKGKGVTKPFSRVSKRTKKQLADERLSEIEAARLEALERERYEKEKAEIARQDAIYAKQLEQEEEMSASQRETRQAKAFLLSFWSTTIYFAGWSMKYMKSLADEQLIAEFEKIRMVVADIKSNELRRTLKRAGEALALDISKKQKSTKVSTPSVPNVPQPQVVSTSKSSGTRRKSLGRSRITKPELDLDADDKTFIKVVSDEDFKEEAPIVWSAFAGWEVLMDSQEGGKGFSVWNHQSLWQIRSWRLYTLSNVHVLETISGEVLYMFADVSYPLSVKLTERMLNHKLEIAKDVVGNDMTTAKQLIRFIKNQLAAAQVSPA
ncbi:hypothetical protein Tco_1410904 [Tanacetum coccineum]